MAKRRPSKDKYVDYRRIKPRDDRVSSVALAMKVPIVVTSMDDSYVKMAQDKPDWSLYRVEFRDGNPFIVREMCDRCGVVWVPPRWRKIRDFNDDVLGTIFFETGLCKTCINASVYVDRYLDGEPLTETEAKNLYYQYASEYEQEWRRVIAAAPNIILTESEWLHRCEFFRGCAFCGANIEVRAKYFPTYLNGTHSPWNVIPLCGECMKLHYAGRVSKGRKVKRYKVFSTSTQFRKTRVPRMYLLQQMRKHDIYMEPLEPYIERFFEKTVLEGSD